MRGMHHIQQRLIHVLYCESPFPTNHSESSAPAFLVVLITQLNEFPITGITAYRLANSYSRERNRLVSYSGILGTRQQTQRDQLTHKTRININPELHAVQDNVTI